MQLESLITRACQAIVKPDAAAKGLTLAQYMQAIPKLDTLAKLPAGTRVLVRGDVDCKPGEQMGQGDIRLRSMLETLKYGIHRGWVQLVFGHTGREKEKSLSKVAKRLGELLGQPVPLVSDWYDEGQRAISANCQSQVKAAANGSVLMLENTRRYDVERLLWDASAADVPALAPNLVHYAQGLAGLAKVYVNEAFSAGSLDSSTVVVPLAMDQVALGLYVADQLGPPMQRCIEASVVVFSGLKIDKLNDLEAIIHRGHVRFVFAAGSLAMALLAAQASIEGRSFCLGKAGDPANKDQGFYIPPERIEQAKAMIAHGRKHGTQFYLPVDFVLEGGRVAAQLEPADQQFDVGPATSKLYADQITQIIESHKSGTLPGKPVVFHNGVFGWFECKETDFARGTREFISQLHRLKQAGLEVYIGGGEGGTALELYGAPNWVTHCFTAGGTVLNALGGEPIPYLQALKTAAEKTV